MVIITADERAEEKKVSEMTVKELKALIAETVYEVLDPDYGLELRPEVEVELAESLEEAKRGDTVPIEEVADKLGLKW